MGAARREERKSRPYHAAAIVAGAERDLMWNMLILAYALSCSWETRYLYPEYLEYVLLDIIRERTVYQESHAYTYAC
jgi:hypothetical protein